MPIKESNTRVTVIVDKNDLKEFQDKITRFETSEDNVSTVIRKFIRQYNTGHKELRKSL